MMMLSFMCLIAFLFFKKWAKLVVAVPEFYYSFLQFSQQKFMVPGTLAILIRPLFFSLSYLMRAPMPGCYFCKSKHVRVLVFTISGIRPVRPPHISFSCSRKAKLRTSWSFSFLLTVFFESAKKRQIDKNQKLKEIPNLPTIKTC